MEKNMPQGDPLVSIRCLVYNHEPYLRQCLDGFVMQETTFPFEAIVHDDASTDGSAAIIREYAEKYPHIIKPIYETENQHSKHDGSLSRIMDEAIHPAAKYIATCEGDDYWTDPHKLQLQIDFLESHLEFVMSCHDYSVYYEERRFFEKEGRTRFNGIEYELFQGEEFHTYDISDFFQTWFASTLTCVYRKRIYIEDRKRKLFFAVPDFIFYYYILKQGKCAFFKRNMAIYRVHPGGIYSGSTIEKWCEYYLSCSYILYELEKDNRLLPKMNKHFIELFCCLFKKGEFLKLIKVTIRHIAAVPINNIYYCIGRIFMRSFHKLSVR